MIRVDEIYNEIKNNNFKCIDGCPYQNINGCAHKQSCIYVKAMKLAMKEKIEKENK